MTNTYRKYLQTLSPKDLATEALDIWGIDVNGEDFEMEVDELIEILVGKDEAEEKAGVL